MPMLLKSEDGKEFELSLIDEPIPDPQDGFGDTAAMVIAFRVATGEEEWEETSPSINSFQLDGLVDWLESVASGSHDEAEIDLLEPELNFQVVKDAGDWVQVRIRFRLEARPEEMNVDAETTEARHVDLRLPRAAIRAAAASLRQDLRHSRGEFKDDLVGDRDDAGVRPPTPGLGIDADSVEAPGEPDEEPGPA